MTKQIECPVCSGHGFISVIDENTISSYTCDHCNGAGEIEVPMTNADRIRAMSDEELAECLEQLPICKEKAQECIKAEYRCGECLLEWLKQPAEGE